MAQTVAVVRQTLTATGSGTTDFTSTGFGTPTAAIVILSNANSTNNPSDNAILSIGFWDGTNQRVNSITSTDAAATSQSYRLSRTDYIAAAVNIGASTTQIVCAYSASAVTDGIRLTMDVDNTGLQRYCTVILIAGVSAKIVTHTPGTTNGSTADSPSIGFAPKVCIGATIGLGSRTADSGTAQTLEAILAFGVTRQSDSATRCLTFNDADALADAQVRQLFSESIFLGQVTTSVVWSVAVTTWGADTFTTTTTGSTGSDIMDVLVLGGDVSVDMGTVTTRTTTGTTDVTSTVTPDALLIALGTTDNAGTIVTDAKANGWSVGMAASSTEYSHNFYVEDAAGTMNTGSVASATAIINLDSSASGTRSDLVDATVTFSSGNFTLDYPGTPSATARKGWWLAFGAAVSALPTLSLSTYKPGTLTAGGWQPRVTAT